MKVKTEKNYLTTGQVARKLKVGEFQVRLWARAGRLEAIIRKSKAGHDYFYFDKNIDLSQVYVAKCLFCHKLFNAKRPQRARYCCLAHKNAYHHQCRKAQKRA